jgi:GNAT superfamily N-acetyltransferase
VTTGDDITIRRATPADLEDLVVLTGEYCIADGHPVDPDLARRGFAPLLDNDDHGTAFIARDSTTALGYAVVCWSWSIEIGGFEVVLDEIYTRPKGTGLGSRLIAALEDDCRQRGVLRIFLETERPNTRARSLYARHGYTEDDSIWMSKTL